MTSFSICFDYMLYVICQVSYVSFYMLSTMCELLQVCNHISLYAYFSTSFCMLYVKSRMPVIVYLHLYVST
jgi:hypothetical protein